MANARPAEIIPWKCEKEGVRGRKFKMKPLEETDITAVPSRNAHDIMILG